MRSVATSKGRTTLKNNETVFEDEKLTVDLSQLESVGNKLRENVAQLRAAYDSLDEDGKKTLRGKQLFEILDYFENCGLFTRYAAKEYRIAQSRSHARFSKLG